MPTFEAFRAADLITRAEMAKIITLYSKKNPWFYTLTRLRPVQATGGKGSEATGGLSTGGLSACAAFTDLKTAPFDLQPFIIQACQLKLMGLQADGITPQNRFLPNENIILSEVATIISRLLR
jgi:hypothetical protein